MEAGVLHCPSCGATVGEHDLRCPYCSSQLATVACPQCFGMVGSHARHCPTCGAAIHEVVAESSILNCPDCDQLLSATTVGGVVLDQCVRCGGLWVDRLAFEKLAADQAGQGEAAASLPALAKAPMQLETVRYRPCPMCAKLMNRQNYGRISGVVVDQCKEHGLWFDRDELRQVMAFIRAGGLVRSRERQELEREEERRLTAAAAVPFQRNEWGLDLPEPDRGGQTLTGVVDALVRLFIR